MKKIIYSILALGFLAACEPENTSDLAKLNAERDSLTAVQKDVSTRIKEINDQLAKLDSTKKLYTVTTLEIVPENFNHYFKVYGTVESNKSINLFAETQGKIESIHVKRGQNVAKGQLLAELDGQVLKQNIAEVEKSLELANEIYKKQSKLWLEDKIGSEVQYLEAKNNKESLDTRLETLKAQYAMTRVRAPFSGVIDEIFPKVGEMASPQSAMFRLVNLSDVYLTASVSEAYVGKVAVGTPAIVNFPSIGSEIKTQVARVGSFINPDNRTFEVIIGIDSEENLKPNMMGSVRIEDHQVDSAIVVPSRIVMESTSGDSYVYVCSSNTDDICAVTKVIVKPGVSYEGKTEILDGLKSGDRIVDRGSRSVKDGQKVRLVSID